MRKEKWNKMEDMGKLSIPCNQCWVAYGFEHVLSIIRPSNKPTREGSTRRFGWLFKRAPIWFLVWTEVSIVRALEVLVKLSPLKNRTIRLGAI